MSIRLEPIDGSMSGSHDDMIIVGPLNQSKFVVVYILGGALVALMIVIAIKVLVDECCVSQSERQTRRYHEDSTMSTCYSSPSYVNRSSDIEFIMDLPSP